jgi:hypothetical protein
VGCWQISRAFALLGDGLNAGHYAQMALDVLGDAEDPFYRGYAFEALARAAAVSGDSPAMEAHLGSASEYAAQVDDKDARRLLEADLATISLIVEAPPR